MYNIRFFRVLKDIQNYIYLIFQINKLSKTREWNKYNLRHGWIYQIGTVINMNKEDFGEKDDILYSRTLTRAKPIFNYLTERGISEIIKPKIKRFGRHYAFKLTFWPKFTDLTIGYILSRSILIYLAYILINYLNKLNLF